MPRRVVKKLRLFSSSPLLCTTFRSRAHDYIYPPRLDKGVGSVGHLEINLI